VRALLQSVQTLLQPAQVLLQVQRPVYAWAQALRPARKGPSRPAHVLLQLQQAVHTV
jgi:hypothetical protein